MSERDAEPAVAEQLQRLQEQLDALAERVASMERRLPREHAPAPAAGMDGRDLAVPGSTAPWLAQPPSAAPPASSAPAPAAAPTEGGTQRGHATGSRPGESPRTSAPSAGIFSAGAASGGEEREGRSERRTTRPASTEVQPWETLIGGKWALWVGSVAVFFAMAFFLAYAWQYLSSAGRLAVGFLAGLAFLGAGRWARGRGEAWFSEGLTGGGLGILYLSIWAGAQRYGLLSFGLAFALMAVTTAAGVVLAMEYDSVSLSALATLGGFLTPALLRSSGRGGPHSVWFLTYVAVLNAGILDVSLFKRWRGIVWLSFAASILLLGWAVDSYTESLRGIVFAFLSLYFLLFLGAACFYSLIRKEATQQEDLLLLFADAFVYATAGYALLRHGLGDYLGIFPLSLAICFALLSVATRVLAPENPTLRASAGGLSLFFLTITIPIQLRQGWIAIGWSVEAAVLLSLGVHLKAQLLQRAGQVVWVVSLLSLLPVLVEAAPAPRLLFLNARALPLLFSVLASGWMAVVAEGRGQGGAGGRENGRAAQKDDLSPAYALAAVLGGAWLIAQETYLAFGWRLIPASVDWRAGALYTISCLWALYALAVFAGSLRLHHLGFRSGALIVAALATVLPIVTGLALPASGWPPFRNPRWVAFVVVTLMLGALCGLSAREQESERAHDARWLVLPIVFALWGLTQETYETFRWLSGYFGGQWERAAQMGISLVWSLCGVLLLIGGAVRRHQPIRWLALGLLGLTATKVFLFDLGFLDTPYRILSFGGLGLALIGISWLYSRYGHLRP